MSEPLIQTPGVFGENENFLLARELGTGGMGGVYMGTFEIGQNEKLLRTYRTDGTLGKAWFGDGTMESCLPAGTWHAGKDLYIRFIPAGAAYLPLRFLLVAGD